MRKNIVFTLTGADRIGIVEAVTKLLVEHDGNVETSRMVRLGGEFAMLALVSLPAGQIDNLNQVLDTLRKQGFTVTASQAEHARAEKYAGWLSYEIEVHGSDHEGIIHQIARHLSQCGINIESMDTGIIRAPMSGTPLFNMKAQVAVPPELSCQNWQDALAEVGHRLDVEITVSPVAES